MQVRTVVAQVERRAAEVRTPGLRLDGVRRLVLVRDDRLGDVVVSLPAVAALRRAYPGARLALMVQEAAAPLARMVVGVDNVLALGDGQPTALSALRTFGPDLVLCVSRSPSIGWAAWRAGIRHRVGPGRRFYAGLFTRRVVEPRRRGVRHELEYALSFAHKAGAPTGEAEFPIEVPETAHEELRGWREALHVKRQGYVVIHPGSGGSCPAWPVASYLDLAGRLARGGHPVVLSVGPADRAVAQSLEAASEPVKSLPRFDGGLQALAALLLPASLVISNSTGPLHLAAALGRTTLGLYAPWASCGPSRWGPYAANGWALVAHSPEAQGWSRATRHREQQRLMAAIPVERVEAAARSLLDGGEIGRL